MYVLHGYQVKAVKDLRVHLSAGSRRATLVMPCGTGKTIVAAHLIPTEASARTVMFVPSLVLARQSVARILRVHPRMAPDQVLYVDSNTDEDERHTTDPRRIANWLKKASGPQVVMCTYASAPRLMEAAGIARCTFDLAICDEAHHTAGTMDKAWALPTRDEFPAQRRLFMTATRRTYRLPGDPDPAVADDLNVGNLQVVSMDDPEIYGHHVRPISLREAIEAGYLSKYRIAVIAVDSAGTFARLKATAASVEDYDPMDLATHLALVRATKRIPKLSSAMAMHNLTAKSKQWVGRLPAVQEQIERDMPELGMRKIIPVHIDGDSRPEDVDDALNLLRAPGDNLALVSNCRMFGEGVDVPDLDAVIFAARRSSGVDIVQIAGRVMRKHSDSEREALIILPVLVSGVGDGEIEQAAAASSRRDAWHILHALAEEDELLHEALVRVGENGTCQGPIDVGPLTIDIPEGLSELAKELVLHTVERTVSANERTLQYLRDYRRAKGSAEPTARKFRGYPLKERLTAVRAAKHRGDLSDELIAKFEKIDGFTWKNPVRRPARRTNNEWLDLLELRVDRSKSRIIPRSAETLDPLRDDKPAAIGEWYLGVRSGKVKLTRAERARFEEIMRGPRLIDGKSTATGPKNPHGDDEGSPEAA
ncbi:hypothetical protein ACT17_05975 [Mycolicibacterium conceptionense]|uniref:Helicase ATP-binding domain-containing protein n=2 Tax=Mycolicibacterium conceptionense TaxID=451644 RepID=A0A0J8UE59_9MYCO|nr:hypothetical protein ACT17_05975 [Mycolicibacterium conceptionense]